jgi:hypothetical protein
MIISLPPLHLCAGDLQVPQPVHFCNYYELKLFGVFLYRPVPCSITVSALCHNSLLFFFLLILLIFCPSLLPRFHRIIFCFLSSPPLFPVTSFLQSFPFYFPFCFSSLPLLFCKYPNILPPRLVIFYFFFVQILPSFFLQTPPSPPR